MQFLQPLPMFDFASRQLQTAAELYAAIDEFKSDQVFNLPAPDPWISFSIGSVLGVITFVLWVVRVGQLKQKWEKIHPDIPFTGILRIRGMISVGTECEHPGYVMINFAAFSFVFLGCIQLDYELGLMLQLFVYFFTAFAQTFGVLLGYWSYDKVTDLIPTSSSMAHAIKNGAAHGGKIKPSSVYEDLGRRINIVVMVFLTQLIMITLVCVDLAWKDTHNCLDGTKDCPVVGTLGSYSFYCVGIFMAWVAMLGPRSKFGQSEQNPAYWVQLLLVTKNEGAKLTWYDGNQDKHYEHKLYKGDKIIWLRFWMSFVINGIGFHILVHALPVEVASQGTFTGVVLNAVGMLYIVSMDDTSEVHVMTIVPPNPDDDDTVDGDEEFEKFQESLTKVDNPLDREAEMIIQEAAAEMEALAAKLEALAARHGVSLASIGDRGKTLAKDPYADAMMPLMAEEAEKAQYYEGY